MRIKKNDVPITVYRFTQSTNADGLVTSSYTVKFSSKYADLQPVGGKFDPALYGINSTPSNVRKMFFDNDIDVLEGEIIASSSNNYMVKNVKTWYSHQEAILEPYEVTIP
jgi:hypothetical protein